MHLLLYNNITRLPLLLPSLFLWLLEGFCLLNVFICCFWTLAETTAAVLGRTVFCGLTETNEVGCVTESLTLYDNSVFTVDLHAVLELN